MVTGEIKVVADVEGIEERAGGGGVGDVDVEAPIPPALDRGIRDEELTTKLLSRDSQRETRSQLRARGIQRAIVWAGDPLPGAKALLDRFLAEQGITRIAIPLADAAAALCGAALPA